MKILYISQYYPPEMGAPSARVSELSREWAKRGHQVTVLTAFPHHPHGKKLPGDVGVLTRREKDGAVDVVRTYVFAARNSGFLFRIVSYVSFMLSAMMIGVWRVGRPDVVIATSPQLFTGVAGWWISRVLGAPFVFEVRDLWPESIVTVGAMQESRAIGVLKRLAAFLYRAADRIVTVGPGYRRRILSGYGIAEDRIDVVTNGVDLELYQFREKDRKEYRQKLGVHEETVVLYLGTHGMAHGLEVVLQAAKRLSGQAIRFVFVGDGAEKPALEKMAADWGLSQVTFVPPQEKSAVVGYYAACDVALVPLRKVDLFTDVLPSKIFEIMGMQRAMIVSVDGDARQEVERARAGLFVEPENVEELAGAITRLSANESLRQELGRSGRSYVESHYPRSVLARRYAEILGGVVDRRDRSSPAVRARVSG
jgi:glycosyltransferase involved in cell wall biosynthesis